MLLTIWQKNQGSTNVLKSTYTSMKKNLEESFGVQKMFGENKYELMSRIFLVKRPPMRGIFSQSLAKLLTLGEFVVLDEKQKSFTGNSPTLRMNKNKPEPIGHMMSQLTVILEEGKLPFCFGFFPYDQDKFIPDSSHSGEELAQWVVDMIRRSGNYGKLPGVVADSLYNTYKARDVYQREKVKLIMAVKPRGWGGVDAFFHGDLEAQGDTRYAWNEKQKVVLCRHWPRERSLGKKYVVPGAFIRDGKPQFNPAVPPVYTEYGLTFSACDNFNMAMSKNWYPYRVQGFEEHWSTMFYSMMFMNIVHLGKHLGVINMNVDFKAAIKTIGLSLLK